MQPFKFLHLCFLEQQGIGCEWNEKFKNKNQLNMQKMLSPFILFV